MSNNYIALICARAGSKGLPGKNTRFLSGKPLIGWSIEIALKIERISRVIVSTDSEDIAKIARDFGAEVPFLRPKELAKDRSSEWDVWRHALEYLKDQSNDYIDAIVSIPPTSPLRSVDDINNCIDKFEEGEVDVVISVTDAHRSPYFNMIKENNSYASLVIKPKNAIFRRQDSPVVYDMTTVGYVADSSFILDKNGIFEGRVKSVHIPIERAIDIDTLVDFELAQCLMNIKK